MSETEKEAAAPAPAKPLGVSASRQDCFDAVQALAVLVQTPDKYPLGGKVGYNVGKLYGKLTREQRAFEFARKALISELASRDADGNIERYDNGEAKFTDEKIEEFTDELQKMKDEVIVIEGCWPIKASQLPLDAIKSAKSATAVFGVLALTPFYVEDKDIWKKAAQPAED